MTTKTLADYLKEVQHFLRDTKQDLLNPETLTQYINVARRETAMRGQCIRRLTPSSGSILTYSVVAGGSGYTVAPTVTVSDPDFPPGTSLYPNGRQATATAIVQSGSITGVYSQDGGAGYFSPAVTLSGGGGSDATISVAALSYINTLNLGQEQYPFSSIDVSMWPGVNSVHMLRSVSVIYANYRYSLPMYSFSVYQAKIRQYPFQYQYVPAFCTQFGQGEDGSLFVYPLPSQTYQWEFDCFCIPSDLTDFRSYEALPFPWTDAVKHWAAYLAFLELQNFNAAEYHFKRYDEMINRYSTYTRPGRAVNPYGRY